LRHRGAHLEPDDRREAVGRIFLGPEHRPGSHRPARRRVPPPRTTDDRVSWRLSSLP
jgi:hypothetical protein